MTSRMQVLSLLIPTASEVSSVQAKEYVKLFNIIASAVIERGYQGKQLENEIKCASGNAYSMLKITPATYNGDSTVATGSNRI